MFIVTALCMMGGGGGSANSNEVKTTGPHEPEENEGQKKRRRAHLLISAVEVSATSPKLGQRFPLEVYVKNVGEAPSGEYDLRIFIKDVSNGYKNDIGTFRRKGLQPGEEAAAYFSRSRPVDHPGSYQLCAEIQPFIFEDSTTNNPEIRYFTVH